MDEENNTIDLKKTYGDLYSALVEAQANEDWGRVSVINQAIKAEDQALAGSDAWREASQRGDPNYGDETAEGIMKFAAGLPLETAGLVKSALIERSPATFFQETFGKGEKGQVTISFDDLLNDEDLLVYLNNMEKTFQDKERIELNDFAKDLAAKYDVESIKDALVLLDEDELIKYQQLLAKAEDPGTLENPGSYIKNYDDRTITFDSSMFPKVAWEPDVKIIDKEKGEVGFPYLGKYGYNDEGEFVKKFSSAFKPFDESEEGLGQYSEYIPEFMKSYQNYAMPEYSPDPDLFKNPGWQIGAAFTGAKGALPIIKAIGKGGKNIYKGLGRYLNQSKPVPITKQEPHFSELPWSR